MQLVPEIILHLTIDARVVDDVLAPVIAQHLEPFDDVGAET